MRRFFFFIVSLITDHESLAAVLGPWMVLLMDPLQPTAINLGVALRRRDIRMAQELLDRPEVCAVCEQVRREGVA